MVTIEIDCGVQKRFWRDDWLKSYDVTFKKFNTIIDALNNEGEIYHSGFKKLFLKSEIESLR
jgi:hypothetical protein